MLERDCSRLLTDAQQWGGGACGRVLPWCSVGVPQPDCKEGGHTVGERHAARLQVSNRCGEVAAKCPCLIIQTLITVFRSGYYNDETPHTRLGMESVDVEEVSLPWQSDPTSFFYLWNKPCESFLSRFLCTCSSGGISHWSSWMAGLASQVTCVPSQRPCQSALWSTQPHFLSSNRSMVNPKAKSVIHTQLMCF